MATLALGGMAEGEAWGSIFDEKKRRGAQLEVNGLVTAKLHDAS